MATEFGTNRICQKILLPHSCHSIQELNYRSLSCLVSAPLHMLVLGIGSPHPLYLSLPNKAFSVSWNYTFRSNLATCFKGH